MSKKSVIRRSGAKIMASLILLLGSLAYIMIFAVISGSLGYLTAMSVTVLGAVGIAKALGDSVALSYGAIIALIIVFGVLRGILRYVEQYSNHYIAFKILAVFRDKIFGALRILCPAKLEDKKKGSIIAMITSDIETLEVFYAHTISPICIAILVSSIVFVFVAVVADIYLALVALFGFAVIGVVLPLISSKALKSGGVRFRREFAEFNAYFLDSIKGVKDIVINNAEDSRKEEVNKRSDRLLIETKRIKRGSSRVGALTECLVSVFIVAALTVGIVLVRADRLTVGRMIIGIVAVFGSFSPVIAVSALPSNLTQTFASGDRILNLIEEEPTVKEIKDGSVMNGFNSLEVKDMSFSYDGMNKILQDIKMKSQKGEIIGIVGSSGSGKSTFLKLLLRFWEKGSGEIDYNGTDISRINTESLLNNVTMVSQSTYLFDETIEDNLRIAKQDATEEEIISACKKASIHDFIASLPDGYKTKVGALGENLSAGEKQRIGIARAFLRESELILLDEPTSNVDSINEGIILASLRKQKNEKSIILVSHRESTMAIADRIYRMDNGIMTEVVK